MPAVTEITCWDDLLALPFGDYTFGSFEDSTHTGLGNGWYYLMVRPTLDDEGNSHYNGRLYLAYHRDDGICYTAAYHNGHVVEWRQAAYAEPPQEYDLPLAEGFTKKYDEVRCNYAKDQFGRVYVKGMVKADEPFGINTLFANLPEGFLPATGNHVEAPAMFSVVGSASFFSGRVFATSEGWLIAATLPTYETTEMVFAFDFLAAQSQ